jgi:DNA-binding NarL/FixJ family response regulator
MPRVWTETEIASEAWSAGIANNLVNHKASASYCARRKRSSAFIGVRALLESEVEFEIIWASFPEIAIRASIDVVLGRDRVGQRLSGVMSDLKVARPSLPVIVIGPSTDDEMMLGAIVCGAKGYVFEGAPPGEFAQAILVVSQGSVWASRRVLSTFNDGFVTRPRRMRAIGNEALTDREKQVLKMLVTGLFNKQISGPLGIVERTVKAHC